MPSKCLETVIFMGLAWKLILKKLSTGIIRQQNMVIVLRNKCLQIAITLEKVWKETYQRHLSDITMQC